MLDLDFIRLTSGFGKEKTGPKTKQINIKLTRPIFLNFVFGGMKVVSIDIEIFSGYL